MAYIFFQRHDTNDLTPAIDSLRPGGKHMLSTTTTKKRKIVISGIKVQQSWKSHSGPYKPHTRAKLDKKVTCRTLQKRLERFETGNRRFSPSCVDWAWFGVQQKSGTFFFWISVWWKVGVILLAHFLQKVVGGERNWDHIRDARE